MSTKALGGSVRLGRLGLLAVAAAAGAAVYLTHFTPTHRAVHHRLAEADARSQAAVDDRLRPVSELVRKGRAGSRAFAEETLSWSGKWALLKGAVDGESHRDHIARAFARHVFDKDELTAAIEAACRGYTDDLQGVEADMLVRLRADLDGLGHPAPAPPPGGGPQAFAAEYARLVERVLGQVRTDVAVEVGKQVAVEVGAMAASQAAAQAARAAAVELGLSGTLLGGAGAIGTVTLGAGIVAGVLIDYLIDAVFRQFGWDAESKIAAEVDASLDRMQAALLRVPADSWVWGKTPPGALLAELGSLHESRAAVRRQAVGLLVRPGPLGISLDPLGDLPAVRRATALLSGEGGAK